MVGKEASYCASPRGSRGGCKRPPPPLCWSPGSHVGGDDVDVDVDGDDSDDDDANDGVTRLGSLPARSFSSSGTTNQSF